jgi:hypothetical protein
MFVLQLNAEVKTSNSSGPIFASNDIAIDFNEFTTQVQISQSTIFEYLR